VTWFPGLNAMRRPAPAWKKAAASAAVLICIASVCACRNPFGTREPEEPASLQATWFQPVSPELVLVNFTAAIEEKNVENYVRCFGADKAVQAGFRFVPERSVANNYQGVFANWSITEERNYINHLFSVLPADSLSSLILSEVTEFQQSDSVRTTKDYDLLLSHTNPSAPRRVIGRMEVTLRKGADALWYISYWADYKTGDTPVWSLLKAEF